MKDYISRTIPTLVPGTASAHLSTPRGGVRPGVKPHRAPAFRWSWKLARVAGIDVYVHGTFVLLIAFIAFSDAIAGHGAEAVASRTLLILAVFATVVLHEFGHALTARRFGVGTRDITLLPIGGVARLDRMPDKPNQQLLVALAGPGVNLVIAAVLFGVVRLLGGGLGAETVLQGGGSFLSQLLWINVSLAVFNLLPGYPMDGGRVLRALLAMRLPPERATQTGARVGQGVAVALSFVGLFMSPLLIVIAVFVWIGAQAEYSVSKARAALTGLFVRDAMITDFKVVSPTHPLSHAVELTLTGFQQDFPVMDGSRLVGVLTHADVLRGLAERGSQLVVQDAARTEFSTATSSEPIDGAWTRMRQDDCRVAMVLDNDRVVGLLTLAKVGELLALAAASRRPGGLALDAERGTSS